ncbi:Scr1 family TA system antitoxin-like transcriptional regulator [Streptomyces sp. NPDC059009]|uniref:helix-turn-helix domain-containing protein n=1 Tax=Streptomyces sp. NPDC059009 TaxID=3346694 RepID=UPI0036A1AC02
MAIEDSPQSREKYGQELKRRREAAGLTQEELSVRAVMSRTHIAHIEAGRRRPDVEDARRLGEVLGAGDFFVEFLPTLSEGNVAAHFEVALQLEQQAVMIREFAPCLVPGLFQTRAYATEVLGSAPLPRTDDERDKMVAKRLERASILDDFKNPVVWALLDEAVLRHPIGGPLVMCEQLCHIEKLGRSRRVRVHVIPYDAGSYALLAGMVSLMWFEDQPPVAYMEAFRMGQLCEVPAVVRECQVAYDLALSDALPQDKSLALIRSIAKEYEHAQQ